MLDEKKHSTSRYRGGIYGYQSKSNDFGQKRRHSTSRCRAGIYPPPYIVKSSDSGKLKSNDISKNSLTIS